MSETTTSNSQPQSVFQVQRYYIKESSCKIPHAPAIFKEAWEAPNTQFELQIKTQALPEQTYEVVIQLNALTKLNERTAFNLDIQQAGLFKIEGVEQPQLDHLLKAYCPALLYPYLSRAVADATSQAGFPPLLLTPMNFDQLYQQQQTASTPAAETALN